MASEEQAAKTESPRDARVLARRASYWLVGAVVVYLVVALIYQFAILPRVEQAHQPSPFESPLALPEPLVLRGSYPAALPGGVDEDRSAVVLWLLKPTPAGPTTPVPTGAPPREYDIELVSTPDFPRWVNKDGIAILSRVRVTPAPAPGAGAAFYIEPVRSGAQASVEIRVWDVQGGGEDRQVQLRTAQEAQATYLLRTVLAALTDPIAMAGAVLVGVIGGLVGLLFKLEDDKRNKAAKEEETRVATERKAAEDRRTSLKTALDKLKELSQSNPSAAVRYYVEVRNGNPHGWASEDWAQLDRQWRALAPGWMSRYADLQLAPTPPPPEDEVGLLCEVYRSGDEELRFDVVKRFAGCFGRIDPSGITEPAATESLETLLVALVQCDDLKSDIWGDATVKATVQALTDRSRKANWGSGLELLRQVEAHMHFHLHLWSRAATEDPPADEVEKAALAELGLRHTPFGSGRAESDHLLTKAEYCGFLESKVKGPRPAIILGDAGSGKTALAILLENGKEPGPYDDRSFVVSVTLPDLDGQASSADWLATISGAFAYYQLRLLAANPPMLLRQPGWPAYTRAVIALLLHRFGGVERVTSELRRHGGHVRAWLAAVEREGVSHAPPPLSMSEHLALLAAVRPLSSEYCYVTIDVPAGAHLSPETARESLDGLFQLVPLLADHRIYAKIFLPLDFEPYLPQDTGISPAYLVWWVGSGADNADPQLDLKALNEARLRLAGRVNPHIWEQDVTGEEFLQACGNNPRLMLRMGQALLGRYGSRVAEGKAPRISLGDIETVRKQVQHG